MAHDPDKTIIAKAKRCCHCAAELNDADHKLHSCHDKIEIPPIKPIVTRVERYAGHCPSCHGITPVPEDLQDGSPFSANILALALDAAILKICNCGASGSFGTSFSCVRQVQQIGHGADGGLVQIKSSIRLFDRNPPSFVPTCLVAERRA